MVRRVTGWIPQTGSASTRSWSHETVNPVPEVAVSSKWDKFTDLQRHF
jgi:hypothetical protein